MNKSKKLGTNEKEFDVVAIGNAIVDILVYANDEDINNHSLQKGNMVLIDQEKVKELYSKHTNSQQQSGGSAANTIANFSLIGGKSGFMGRIKDDALGKVFSQDISSIGVRYESKPKLTGENTAQCFIFVTPDGQRTMCTYLGASVYLGKEDLNFDLINNAKILYLEGYLWDSPQAKEAFIEAASFSKDMGGEIALSLSDSFCVERHRESFLDLINNKVDILFANESEIKSLYKTEEIDEAIEKIKGKCKIILITLGEKGSIILENKNKVFIKPYFFGKAIDTTGAGDIYASGFLKGYTEGRDIITSGHMGSICAGHIVTKLGARSDISLKQLIKDRITI